MESINDVVQEKLCTIAKGDDNISEAELKEYRKRKLITNM